MLNITPALRSLYTNGGIFQFSTKVQVLDKNYNILAEITDDVIDGRVSIDRNRSSTRNFELKLQNTSSKYTWGQNNLIWIDKKIKIFFGVLVNGSYEWLSQGVFGFSPIATSKPGENYVELKGNDKMSYLGKCTDNLTVMGGVSSPVSALSLAASGSGSSLTATTYYVQFDYSNSAGRTTTGNSQSSIAVTAGQNIQTTIAIPSNATGIGIYIGTASNPVLLGTISSGGTITYSGTATSGLSVTFSGNVANITISAPASATGSAALTTSTAVGTDIATAIKSVLNGIETMFNLDDTSSKQRVPYDMSWNAGTDYSKIITDLANIISWEIYYDVNGYLRLRAPIDPTTTAPQWTLSSQPTGFNLWAGAERQLDDADLANYIVVNGGSSQTGYVQYVLQDNDPTSPTSVQNIGQRVYLHNNGNPDPVIVTSALAQYRAQYEYKKRIQVVEKLNFDMFPCPFMEHDDVYSVTDSANGTSGNYLVISFTLPLGVTNQMQTGYLWKIRFFGF